MEAFIPR